MDVVVAEQKRGRGRPKNGFDKKQYDRDRMKRLRAEAKSSKAKSPPNNPDNEGEQE